jgi:hypothetical protein
MLLRSVALAVSVAAATAVVSAQPTRLPDVLSRATAYVEQFVDKFASVVADEEYEQAGDGRRRRRLHSEYLLVRYPGATQWLMFRDVLTVDGAAVSGREGRLTKLFLEPPASAVARAGEIARESARYNLADIGTLNHPLIALAFLQPDYQTRFRFRLGSVDTRVSPRARIVTYEESARPTLLRSNNNGNLVAFGRLWIDDETGAVLKTELKVGVGAFPIQIVTTFAADLAIGVHVPVEMQEYYPQRNGSVSGTARYSRYRRFVVRTDETVR